MAKHLYDIQQIYCDEDRDVFEIPDEAIFAFRYTNVKQLTKFMNAARVLKTCNVHGHANGLFIRGLTDDHVMYFDLTLGKEMFDKLFFKPTARKTIEFGLTMDMFYRYLSNILNANFVDVFLIGTDLRISYRNISYSIKLLEIQEEESVKSPMLNSETCFIELNMNVDILKEAISLISKIGETIRFDFLIETGSGHETLRLFSEDLINGSGHVDLPSYKGSGLEFLSFGEARFTYNLKLIEKIFKFNFQNSISLLFSRNGAMKSRQDLFPEGYMDFIVAPQIED